MRLFFVAFAVLAALALSLVQAAPVVESDFSACSRRCEKSALTIPGDQSVTCQHCRITNKSSVNQTMTERDNHRALHECNQDTDKHCQLFYNFVYCHISAPPCKSRKPNKDVGA